MLNMFNVSTINVFNTFFLPCFNMLIVYTFIKNLSPNYKLCTVHLPKLK